MIALSITLMFYTNAVIYALLNDYSTVVSIKDYFQFCDRIMIVFNIVWIVITAFIYIVVKTK